MPRQPRCRCIRNFPAYWSFSPDDPTEQPVIMLTLDEYETIRLLDREGLTQEQCAGRMQIARTTVTAIYESARQKLATALVDGCPLHIAGGFYRMSPDSYASLKPISKGKNIMRIAATYENGEIFQHFGRTGQFKFYDVEDGKIVSSAVVGTNGMGHGALAGFLQQYEVDALICGGMGPGAQMAMAEAGIKIYPGVSGSADEAAKALAEGNLQYDPNAHCDHHEHEEGHECGHGEGGHCCH